MWFGTDPLADINPQNSPYVYCKSNPIIRIDPDGMKDYAVNDMDGSTWHNFDTNNDAIILDEVTKVKPHVDQEYGQTVTGGYDGKGSDATSRFHGPSIDASDLGYSFDGWGSRGMEFVYNLLQRFRDLFEMIQSNNFVDYNKHEDITIQHSQQGVNNVNSVKVRPIIPGPRNYHGKIQYAYPDSNGDTIHADKDTTGAVIYYISHDKIDSVKTINFSPKNAKFFFKKQ